MNSEEELQNKSSEVSPTTYCIIDCDKPSEIKTNTQATCSNITTQFCLPTGHMSLKRGAKVFQLATDSNKNYPRNLLMLMSKSHKSSENSPENNRIHKSDLPPAYKNIFPTKNNFFITLLKKVWKLMLLIFSTAIALPKQIYNWMTIENLKGAPLELFIVMMLSILHYKCVEWIEIIAINIRAMFDDVFWHFINFLSFIMLCVATIISIIIRAKNQKNCKKIYMMFGFIMIYNFSCLLFFISTYFNVIERLYYENKL